MRILAKTLLRRPSRLITSGCVSAVAQLREEGCATAQPFCASRRRNVARGVQQLSIAVGARVA
jgi:hypothetical protein